MASACWGQLDEATADCLPACIASGDRYDGKWEDGEQSGVGVFTWGDGSSYNGFWRNGRKHGVGVCLSASEYCTLLAKS